VIAAALALAGTIGLISQPAALAGPKGATASSWKETSWFWSLSRIEAMSCTSTSFCVAGGDGSVALVTTDGAKSWAGEMLPLGVTDVTAVDCVSKSVCEAVGESEDTAAADLLRTTDGGKTWISEKLPRGLAGDASGSVTAARFSAVACYSASVCEVVGTYSDSKGYVAVALRTTDGGAKWVRKTLPGNGTVNDVSCPSRSTCEAVFQNNGLGKAEVLRTTNGSKNWSHETLLTGNAMLSAVSCPSSSTCFAGGYNYSVPGQDDTVVLRTRNGGRTWTQEVLPYAYSDTVQELACRSTLVCEALGPEIAFRTIDGGAKWASATLPIGDGQIAALSCPSTSTCLAGGYSDGLPNEASAGEPVALGSTNYATKWVTRDTLPGSAFTLTALACRSSVCQAGGDGAVRTTNNGRSWVSETLPAGAQIGAIACPSTSVCEAVDQNVTLRTTDGGRTWVSTTLPTAAGNDVGAIACPSTSVCEAVDADSGVANRTTDGGKTWVSRTFPKIGGFEALACPSTSICEALGVDTSDYVESLRTTDGGKKWVRQNLPDSLLANSIVCPTISICEAVGETTSSGVITIGAHATTTGPEAAAIRTTNGGKSWSTHVLPSTSNGQLDVVACPTQSMCEATAVLEGNPKDTQHFVAMFRTTNGGITWHAQDLPAGLQTLPAVACPSPSTCEAVAVRQGGPEILRLP
jgi:photosystem II stability/assembly factor-like uncharacterized protein